MDRFDYLDRRRQAELNHADLATCPDEKRKHEEQARAYAKIISVLRREEEGSLHIR
ncbi:hypothetical protein [Sphingobium sp. EM0848]|uniref:hypothetical protein n=1 Tax=Sphingobium sp. EM0848 TaxID=2743473 RepID=UPI00159C0879|nr:hypothetical protein [Sphingobium sp. EM0848]